MYAALNLTRQGYSAMEIRAYLEEHAYDASIYVSVDSFEYLKKGGRITPAAATFAAVLSIKPVLTIQGDKLDSYAKARGMRQAQAVMLKAVRQDRVTRFAGIPDSGLQLDVAGTFEREEQALRWLYMAQEEFPGLPVSYARLPCSIACHVGMNAAGLGIMKKEVMLPDKMEECGL